MVSRKTKLVAAVALIIVSVVLMVALPFVFIFNSIFNIGVLVAVLACAFVGVIAGCYLLIKGIAPPGYSMNPLAGIRMATKFAEAAEAAGVACPACKAFNDRDAKFCKSCGALLKADDARRQS